MAHAERSPSSHKRWGGAKGCRASIKQSAGKPNRSSEAAYQGSAEHYLIEQCLVGGLDPLNFVGQMVVFYSPADGTEQHTAFADKVDLDSVNVAKAIVLDEEAIDRCCQFVSYVRERVAQSGGTLHVEVRVPIDHITGEKGAHGTSDVVIIWPCGTTYEVIDYKGGSARIYAYEYLKHKEVDEQTGAIVSPDVLEPNGQLAMYASGVLRMFDLMDEAREIRLCIVQPRIKHVSDFALSRAALDDFIDRTRVAATETYAENPAYNPSADNCFFCPGRFDCKARETAVLSKVVDGFPDLDAPEAAPVPTDESYDLGTLLPIVALARRWADDVEEAAFAALDNGKVLRDPSGLRYKLVSGKRGRRAWSNDAQVRDLVEQMRLSAVMYSRELVSPAVAEKLASARRAKGSDAAEKPAIGPTQWKRLAALITQAEGKAEIALETDPRPERHHLELEHESAPQGTPAPESAAPTDTGTNDDLFAL